MLQKAASFTFMFIQIEKHSKGLKISLIRGCSFTNEWKTYFKN